MSQGRLEAAGVVLLASVLRGVKKERKRGKSGGREKERESGKGKDRCWVKRELPLTRPVSRLGCACVANLLPNKTGYFAT